MALKLSEGIAEVRALTRHDVDTRVTDAFITTALNRACRSLRATLSIEAPSLYLATSDEITLTAADPEISLIDTDYNFENIHRVEKLWNDENWRPLMRADGGSPNESIHGRVNFRIEHLCLMIGPDTSSELAGTYRVVFHPFPANVSDVNAYFQIPGSLDRAMVALACVDVADRDGDDPKRWEDKASSELKAQLPAIKRRHGVHSGQTGLRRALGY